MLSIRQQCKELYLRAFEDDLEFTDLLFDKCFEDCCYFLTEGETVVSMLFALDITINGIKGKYVYAVATDENYRGKGYMRKLFENAEEKLRDKYAFLCLRPMNEGLFEFYQKLGFEEKLHKSEVTVMASKNAQKFVRIKNSDVINKVRKKLLKENSAEYGNVFTDLLLSYCDVYTDSISQPKCFVVKERNSSKVKEVLGDSSIIPADICTGNVPTIGNDYRYAMFKSLGYSFDGYGYLGLAMD